LKPALKHRWSISHNYLTGITAGDWWRLLRQNGFAVDPVYWHRAAFVSVLSLANSFYRRREEKKHDAEIAATTIQQPPLFILGHWRSGTTHLHNLLAQDDGGFAYANTYQVVNPHIFLTTEEVRTRRFAKLLPDKRPMDNMALSFESPQEDEFAPLLITLLSSYLGVSFRGPLQPLPQLRRGAAGGDRGMESRLHLVPQEAHAEVRSRPPPAAKVAAAHRAGALAVRNVSGRQVRPHPPPAGGSAAVLPPLLRHRDVAHLPPAPRPQPDR
jgi:hypothetical protein